MRGHALKKRHIAAVVAGNALEFYDFITYAFFAIQIGHSFFPGGAEKSLLYSLATFGAGFLTRPLGGLILGSLGDRIGRRPAMMISFSLMGVAILGVALTPSYAVIGVAAPVMVVFFRMLQGFALGGEVGPTTAFLIEGAPPLRRGFYVAITAASQDFSVLIAGAVGTIIASVLPADQLQEWGWRIAFIVGACIVPIGLIVRRSLPETLGEPDESGASPPRPAVRPYARLIVLILMMLACATICNYTIDYMTTYANATLHMKANIAFGATFVIGLFSVSGDLVSGWLSDRFGRRITMIVPYALMLLAVLPCFYFISHERTVVALYAATALLATLQCLGGGPSVTILSESVPRRIRSGVVATVYAFAIAAFGGSTQFMVTWIIDLTGDPLAPAYYMMGAVALGLVAMALVKETAPAKTGITQSL